MSGLDESPFFEEFDSSEVVNRYVEKKESPKPEFAPEKEETFPSGPDSAFTSFLVLRNISELKSDNRASNLIPAELINDTGQVVEISDSFNTEGHNHDDSQRIAVSRNESGDITRIEITCSCGERTILNFEEGFEE